MSLNGVMAVILRYFSEFAYLPGVLRKSSRSLSHHLMSSCSCIRMTREIVATLIHTVYAMRVAPEHRGRN